MHRSVRTPGRRAWLMPTLAATVLAIAAACADQPVGTRIGTVTPDGPPTTLQAMLCTARVSGSGGSVSCAPERQGNARNAIIGNQGVYVKLTSSNVSYDSQSGIFQFDETVQNLLNESIGTPDGVVADSNGIRVFFATGPTPTAGSGEITVVNADGTDLFTSSNQPYFLYSEILAKDQVSQSHTWQLLVPNTVSTFTFTVYVSANVQPLLVINELTVNPAGTTNEITGDWVEVYNAGTLKVEMQGLLLADSAASGRRPYHEIASSLVVQPGAYVVLGGSTNSTTNNGATVDYSWGSAVSLASSLDAFKLARLYGTDTLTIDRTQYSQASVSAQDGVSRELKNPALDNSNMDGSNWASALVTAVYTNGSTSSRGTPKAQNSNYTP